MRRPMPAARRLRRRRPARPKRPASTAPTRRCGIPRRRRARPRRGPPPRRPVGSTMQCGPGDVDPSPGSSLRRRFGRLRTYLERELALDRVVERLADRGADQHLDAGDGVAVLVVPVVAALRLERDDGDARVVLAFEPQGGYY